MGSYQVLLVLEQVHLNRGESGLVMHGCRARTRRMNRTKVAGRLDGFDHWETWTDPTGQGVNYGGLVHGSVFGVGHQTIGPVIHGC